MVMGPMTRNTPKRRSDPPPMRIAIAIMEYAIKCFTGNTPFRTFGFPYPILNTVEYL
jgi:hypothetical protein